MKDGMMEVKRECLECGCEMKHQEHDMVHVFDYFVCGCKEEKLFDLFSKGDYKKPVCQGCGKHMELGKYDSYSEFVYWRCDCCESNW